eukprot:m.233556 g.233556  ORF g.233556 m.233556 type:complete len:299 (-) comp18902_c1_seq8:2837-3733(-)
MSSVSRSSLRVAGGRPCLWLFLRRSPVAGLRLATPRHLEISTPSPRSTLLTNSPLGFFLCVGHHTALTTPRVALFFFAVETMSVLAAVRAARQGVSYTLGGRLYLALTNKSNARRLIDTRGPGFAMPADSHFAPLDDPEPEPAELAAIVSAAYEDSEIGGMGESDTGVTFAGLGEPLLRLDRLVETIALVKEHRHGVPFRVVTNGLFGTEEAAQVAECGVSKATVSLMSADPRQHAELMDPAEGRAHSDVCAFVCALAEAGVEVECTAVKAPGVDVSAARALSEALGAVAFRTRDYFP